MSKMFIRDGLPPQESHWCSNHEKEIFGQLHLQQPMNDFCWHPSSNICTASSLFQRLLLEHTMDHQQCFPQVVDSNNDEAFVLDDVFPEYVSGAFMGTAGSKNQTPAPNVSGANVGRGFGPSHLQLDKDSSGNEMFLPGSHVANAYNQSFSETFDNRYLPWEVYRTSALTSPSTRTAVHDGLPSSTAYNPAIPIFGEPLDYSYQGNRSMLNSSMSSSAESSIASEGMASMTLGSSPISPLKTESRDPGLLANYPATISPRALHLNPSPAPPVTSTTSLAANVATHDSSVDDASAIKQESDYAKSASRSKSSRHRSRKELPDKPSKSRSTYAGVSSSSSSKDKNRPLKPRDRVPLAPPAPESRHILTGNVDNYMAADWSERDRFLVNSKLAGMTYKQIRLQGNFSEAESTLRGRFRTLTKNKEARVRNPKWEDNDVNLLKKAVRKYSENEDPTTAKISWKKVSEYIASHGGSYQFGNATCRKKWDNLLLKVDDEGEEDN